MPLKIMGFHLHEIPQNDSVRRLITKIYVIFPEFYSFSYYVHGFCHIHVHALNMLIYSFFFSIKLAYFSKKFRVTPRNEKLVPFGLGK